MKSHQEIILKWIKNYKISEQRGWADPSISPRAFAYIMDASTLDLIYDKPSADKLEDDGWVHQVTTTSSLYLPDGQLIKMQSRRIHGLFS